MSGTFQGAGGVGGLLLVEAGQACYVPAYDHRGNVVDYLDAADGSTVASFAYGPFGETLRETGPKVDELTYRFSTKPTDTTTKFIHYELRTYDPIMGRWLSRDPIGERGGLNLYGFVSNDGVNKVDRLGMTSIPANPAWFLGSRAAGHAVSKFGPPGLILGVGLLMAPEAWKAGEGIGTIIANAQIAGALEDDIGDFEGEVNGAGLNGAAVGAWIRSQSNPAAALNRARRCRRIHESYKSDQRFKPNCNQATTCAELVEATRRVASQLRKRDLYNHLNCDEIPWGGQAKHGIAAADVTMQLKNCYSRFPSVCGCSYKKYMEDK